MYSRMTRVATGCMVLAGIWGVAAPTAADDAARARRRTPVVEVFEKCRDAVVNISTSRRMDQGMRGRSLLHELFNTDPTPPEFGAHSVGSGAIIHPNGYVVTNAHVIGQATDIKVTFADGSSLPADLIAMDAGHDLAVIRIHSSRTFPTVRLGRSDDLMVGETVVAIGNPVGLKHTVTTGIVSAVDRELRFSREVVYKNLIQTDAPINPGNSGGPLLNVEAELIGINTAIRGDAQNIGFAIPVDKLWDMLPRMLDIERKTRVRFGLQVAGPDARVVAVRPNSPAAHAGLRTGDRVLRFANEPIHNTIDYYVQLLSQKPDSKIRLQVERDGRSLNVDAPLESIPFPDGAKLAQDILGLKLRPVSPALRRQYSLDNRFGLMVAAVDPAGPAAKVQLDFRGDVLTIQPDDVIYSIDGVPVNTLDEVGLVLEKIEPDQLVTLNGIGLRQPYLVQWEAQLPPRK